MTSDPSQSFESLRRLGLLLGARGRDAEAAVTLGRAARLRPHDPVLLNNLAVACERSGRPADAEGVYRRAIALRAGYPEAHNNLGNTLRKMGRLDEAVASHRRAVELRAGYADAYAALGRAYTELGQPAEAVGAYREAVRLKPDSAGIGSSLLYTLHYHPSLTPEQIRDEHLAWAGRHAEPLRPKETHFPNDPDPDRRLRVGYVSADFRRHPTWRFFEPLLARHDRSRVEAFCYSGVKKPDDATERAKRLSDHWREIGTLSDEGAARLVRDDRIDLLVDLAGHGAGGRMLLFARKPAPVQLAMIAYPDTTGFRAMDYRITDERMDPPGTTEHLYSEKLIRLPRSSWCYHADPASPPVAPPPCLHNGFVTFGCLNRLIKVTEPMLELWCRILAQVPGSPLVLAFAGGERENPSVRRRLVAHGVPGDRLDLLPRAPTGKYLERYAGIDIALDPYPYAGATTTCDALWMGVPVVTLAGRSNVSRSGAGLLAEVGLADLVCDSPDRYVSCAVRLARDPRRLEKLRSDLRGRMAGSALCDEAGYAGAVESALRLAWGRWCERAPSWE